MRISKFIGLILAIIFIIPHTLALEPETYFVTSEITKAQIKEEVEIVGKTENLEDFQLKLPLYLKDLQVSFNTEALDCGLQEHLHFNILTCPIEQYKGTYFIKLAYNYRPIDLDDELLIRTIHEPHSKNFVFIAKLSENYNVPADIIDFVSPAPTSRYTEGNRQILYWKLDDIELFEASIIAKSTQKINITSLIIAILLALTIALFIKFRKKAISPQFIESEQTIVDALKKQKKPIKQKELQKLTNFSKARLSRLLNNLEKREVVQKKPWGRTNLIELKRK